MPLFLSDNDKMEQLDMTMEHKEEINMKEDINILIVSDKGTLLLKKNIKEMEEQINQKEKENIKLSNKILSTKNHIKCANDIKKVTAQLKANKLMIDINKLDKMVYMFYIEKKNITKMAELLKSKYNKLFSELFENSEELVEIGAIDEGDHLLNANTTKRYYERSMKHLDLYTTATFILITNKPIEVN